MRWRRRTLSGGDAFLLGFERDGGLARFGAELDEHGRLLLAEQLHGLIAEFIDGLIDHLGLEEPGEVARAGRLDLREFLVGGLEGTEKRATGFGHSGDAAICAL